MEVRQADLGQQEPPGSHELRRAKDLSLEPEGAEHATQHVEVGCPVRRGNAHRASTIGPTGQECRTTDHSNLVPPRLVYCHDDEHQYPQPGSLGAGRPPNGGGRTAYDEDEIGLTKERRRPVSPWLPKRAGK